MTSTTEGRTATRGSGLLRGALVPAGVTALAFVPELFRDPAATQEAPAGTLLWVVVLAVAAPTAAYLTNRRRPVAVTLGRALLVGLPQLPVLVLLSMLDVWLDVRSGYLLAGSGEEAMSYGIGATVSLVTGLVLTGLVALAARLGARRGARA